MKTTMKNLIAVLGVGLAFFVATGAAWADSIEYFDCKATRIYDRYPTKGGDGKYHNYNELDGNGNHLAPPNEDRCNDATGNPCTLKFRKEKALLKSDKHYYWDEKESFWIDRVTGKTLTMTRYDLGYLYKQICDSSVSSARFCFRHVEATCELTTESTKF